jgi:hypothetical protein
MSLRSGLSTAVCLSLAKSNLRGAWRSYLDSQGCLAYATIAQHHQLVQRHLPRHGSGLGDREETGVCTEEEDVQEAVQTAGQRTTKYGEGVRGGEESSCAGSLTADQRPLRGRKGEKGGGAALPSKALLLSFQTCRPNGHSGADARVADGCRRFRIDLAAQSTGLHSGRWGGRLACKSEGG